MGKKARATRGPRWRMRPAYAVASLVVMALLGLWQAQVDPATHGFRVPSPQFQLPSDPRVHVLGSYPHDPSAFTQGLLVESPGILIESTGLYDKSSVRRVNATSGDVLLHASPFPAEAFGEGIALNSANDTYIALTWQSRMLYVLDKTDFRVLAAKPFGSTRNEGWGITTMESSTLVVSDGSHVLHFWDAHTLAETRQVVVRTANGQPVRHLNELEYARGHIYANVWYSNAILKIDPATGAVVASYDLSTLCTNAHRDAVLNGIAYDDAHDVFFITGKLWDTMYLVQLDE
ncbi:hypothetical protein SPRG_20040 [Saprolegnia parasitica CBS 223.65]|uniref:Glutamine cyclotransferase n=1 Tax=Saprolegnia parasitica (strain CBS 223.65) TaxID=695850 RepID=A0A067CEC0_SAPPC|nr:hypothetical protein SPRG_20040 [Saprolegnia parasitica CBS 223.65]KDO28838.1 hypothetical protein SPRG_20040 [Saprolegnia parasitica CBS 223.65]|eukprot:XP_012200568.1 hypothetical protein SPRG_20040 [Saprolegnia parasitica CBS 223.65]